MRVLIDFEDVAEGAVITTQYQKKGVISDGAAVRDEDDGAAPHSGLQYVMYFTSEFQATPTTATFRFPQNQKRVKLWAGSLPNDPPSYGLLVAYDLFGNQVASDGPHQLTPGACAAPFEVKAAPGVIAKVELLGYAGVDSRGFQLFPSLVVDDLEFEADPEVDRKLLAVEPILVLGVSDAGLVFHPIGNPEPPGGPFGRGARNVITGLIAAVQVEHRVRDASASMDIQRAAIGSAIAELKQLSNDLGEPTREQQPPGK
jgi:hypothetical protein